MKTTFVEKIFNALAGTIVFKKPDIVLTHDMGISHQTLSYHAKPGMVIVGTDNNTCAAGAFNAMALEIEYTEVAELEKKEEISFRVPESIKITLTGKLQEEVDAKDLSQYIIGMIGSAGANYMSIEYHGEGVSTLSIPERMTIANMATEMGAMNAVFPHDDVLADFYGEPAVEGLWADEGANYAREIDIDLDTIERSTTSPHCPKN